MPIVVEKLNHIYMADSDLSHIALKDVSFEIREGEFLSIIGHTGSGKSTLIQHLNGLVQPTSGRVSVDGLNPSRKEDRIKVRRLVGMVFQYPEYQLFEETVEKDIAFGPKNLGLAPEETDFRVREAMDLVGLDYDRYAKISPFDLSGGQRRRTALAGIMAMRPKYMVLDEPMAGLDPKGRREVLASLYRLRETTGCAIVMVSHSMEDVARVSDRIIALEKGEIVLQGSPQEVFSHAGMLEEMGLGLPETAKLALLLRQRGIFVPEGIFREDEMVDWLRRELTHV